MVSPPSLQGVRAGGRPKPNEEADHIRVHVNVLTSTSTPSGSSAQISRIRVHRRPIVSSDGPRIDADCVMAPDALAYSVPGFRDPRIGSVGAMEEPRPDDATWFHRLRVLETLFQFRFLRLGQGLQPSVHRVDLTLEEDKGNRNRFDQAGREFSIRNG